MDLVGVFGKGIMTPPSHSCLNRLFSPTLLPVMQHMHVRTYSRVRTCTYFIIHVHPAGLPGPVQPPEHLSALRDHLQNLAHLPLLVYCFKVSLSTTILGVMHMYVYRTH